ncbi:histidine kinase [Intrasporangium oryzae NRRL B-24470]|uniref:Circadian input-output histidine kinase CikA n=1 Tax=Intrasporangium oryzae NRRL B-24470 TaxID=1386089 RepID=W9G9B9_9MICO|nr:histidine kinase [Intrasporangium oryzae NRRL B-24470]
MGTLEGRLARAQEQFRATSDILAVLASDSSAQEQVFDAVVENARRLLNAQVAQIYLVEGDSYHLARSVGMSREFRDFIARHPIRRDRATLVGRVTLDRVTQHIPDVLADPEYGRTDFQRLGGYRSMMGAPMLVGERVVGALSVWRTEVDPFDEDEEALLSTFAEQAALAVRHVQLFTALESRSAELGRKVDQLEALADVGEAISSSLDPDEVLTMIVSRAVQLSGTDGGSLMEYDDASRTFNVRTAYGTSPDVIAALREAEIHIDETWVGRAARDRAVHQITDLAGVPLDPHLRILFESGWRSLIAIPLVRPDRVVGALVVRRKSPGSFSADTCEMLTAFASQSAVALTNARLYQQLERQSIELAQASRHKSEFLASMSHELRTPLNAVIGFSEVLLERMFGELNERQEDYLQDIHAAGRHLLALLGDILDLSKIEAGRMELDVTSFPIADVLDQTIALVRERATLHGIRLTLDADESLGLVDADELRLKQVLLNLLSNAVKFTPDGGRVEVHATREDDSLVITVSDTGVGIEADDQVRIFDSFQQGGRSASTAEGTGLGLTLTKRIVELHGGRMWLVSTPGEGSTFGLSIPQPQRRAPAHDELWMTEDAVPTGPLVVVIEDDPRSAELVSLHLEAAGLTVVVSRSGEDGLDAVRMLEPAAVILDIHLPGMSGWDVLATLKGEAATAGLPVVVVSVEPERGRGFALGAAEYLVKPVRGEHLLAAVERALPAPVAADRDADVADLSAVIVDDDPLALKLVRSTLEPLGWTVHTCSGGQDAAELVRAVAPSVVIMDLLMPEVDGFAVIEQLRPDLRASGPPIVVLTAKPLTPRDRERLEGRIAFVAQKAGLDLADLAKRLAAVATGGSGPGEQGGGREGAGDD